MLLDTINESAAVVIFAVIVFVIYFAALSAVALFALTLYRMCRWLGGHSWRDVIVATEKKALR